MAFQVIQSVFVFVFCVLIGSFLSAAVYRIPRKINLLKGYSCCPACKHRLMPKDLIPVFSRLFLASKCRYCKAHISLRYTVIETLSGVCGLLLFLYLGALQAALAFAVFCVLLCVTFIDADTMQIPDGLNIALAVCGLLSLFVWPEISVWSRVIGIFAVSLPLFLCALFIRGAFGMGDVKLMLGAGLLLGWRQEFAGFFIAMLLGGVYGVVMLLRREKGRKDHFAFGPCLSVGIFTALLCGRTLIDWFAIDIYFTP